MDAEILWLKKNPVGFGLCNELITLLVNSTVSQVFFGWFNGCRFMSLLPSRVCSEEQIREHVKASAYSY